MASLQASALVSAQSPSVVSSPKNKTLGIRSSMYLPRKYRYLFVTAPKIAIKTPARVQDLRLVQGLLAKEILLMESDQTEEKARIERKDQEHANILAQAYAILEIVIERTEMHKNLGEQRNNWNTLLLVSINSITLSAAALVGAMSAFGPLLAFKLPSIVLLFAAASILTLMNKIQPSQLAEEQRNAARLFGQLRRRIESAVELGEVSRDTVDGFLRSTLALDRAFPLPLLGAMIEKFPKEFKPARWWPNQLKKSPKRSEPNSIAKSIGKNGWDQNLEREMKELIEVIKTKDSEDYGRLGSKVLKLSRLLAVSGPVLTGLAALTAAFVGVGHGPGWAPIAAMTSAALATIVNTLEHGGQVGMVLEMYRNTAGFFMELEESIESTLGETDTQKRENGELFETKVAMKLGRSLSELRSLAKKSRIPGDEGKEGDEFASKIF